MQWHIQDILGGDLLYTGCACVAFADGVMLIDLFDAGLCSRQQVLEAWQHLIGFPHF